MSGTYYATEGGGTAEKVGTNFVWIEPPHGLGATRGELIPDEWGVVGPFDNVTNRIVPEYESDHAFFD